MAAPTTLTLPDVLLLYRHDQGLSRQQVAREAGLCPHCYENLEAGRGLMSRQGLETLYIRLPIVGSLMTDMALPLPTGSRRSVSRLQALIHALERRDPESQAVEVQRIRLQLAWQETPSPETVQDEPRLAAGPYQPTADRVQPQPASETATES